MRHRILRLQSRPGALLTPRNGERFHGHRIRRHALHRHGCHADERQYFLRSLYPGHRGRHRHRCFIQRADDDRVPGRGRYAAPELAPQSGCIAISRLDFFRHPVRRHGSGEVHSRHDRLETGGRARARLLPSRSRRRRRQHRAAGARHRRDTIRALEHCHTVEVREPARARSSNPLVCRGRRPDYVRQSILVRLHRSLGDADSRLWLDQCYSSRRSRSSRQHLADFGPGGKGLRG